MTVVSAYHDRDAWPLHAGRKGHFSVGIAYGHQRRFRRPAPIRQAEVPVVHILAARIPIVGPRKDKGAGASASKCGSELPVKHVRLLRSAVSPTIEPHFGHQQWTVARQILQPGQVSLETRLRFQINVEARYV